MNILIFDIFTKISLVNRTIDEKRAEDVFNWWIIFFNLFDENKMKFIVDFLSIQISLFLFLISSNMTQREKKRFLEKILSSIRKKNNCFYIWITKKIDDLIWYFQLNFIHFEYRKGNLDLKLKNLFQFYRKISNFNAEEHDKQKRVNRNLR
jgi:hypothetical protein